MPARAKTLHEHLKDGSFRWDRHGNMAAAAGRDVKPPRKPKGLEGEAAKLWNLLVRELKGIVGQTDAIALEMMCRWWSEWQRVEEALRAATPGTVEYGRLMRGLATSSAHFQQLAGRFGLTPIDRERLPPPATAKTGEAIETKPTERYFFQYPACKRQKGGDQHER